jgi:hypothetical protein
MADFLATNASFILWENHVFTKNEEEEEPREKELAAI